MKPPGPGLLFFWGCFDYSFSFIAHNLFKMEVYHFVDLFKDPPPGFTDLFYWFFLFVSTSCSDLYYFLSFSGFGEFIWILTLVLSIINSDFTKSFLNISEIRFFSQEWALTNQALPTLVYITIDRKHYIQNTPKVENSDPYILSINQTIQHSKLISDSCLVGLEY